MVMFQYLDDSYSFSLSISLPLSPSLSLLPLRCGWYLGLLSPLPLSSTQSLATEASCWSLEIQLHLKLMTSSSEKLGPYTQCDTDMTDHTVG